MTLCSVSVCRRAGIFLLALGLPLLGADPPAGLKNFQQVNDHIYRGAQPSGEGLRSLANLGVKVVIDLRESGARAREEARQVQSFGMRYVNVPMNGIAAPTREQTSQVLALLNDPAAGLVFVHCRRGADRTGTMIALYRISHDHWDNRRALKEAKSYKMAGWERLMQSYVMHYRPGDEAASPQPMVAAGAAQ
jgi:tyrosine-protein phosphatase SIW14